MLLVGCFLNRVLKNAKYFAKCGICQGAFCFLSSKLRWDNWILLCDLFNNKKVLYISSNSPADEGANKKSIPWNNSPFDLWQRSVIILITLTSLELYVKIKTSKSYFFLATAVTWTSCMCLGYESSVRRVLLPSSTLHGHRHFVLPWEEPEPKSRGWHERKQRCAAADISPHAAEICVAFVFVSKACEQKHITSACASRLDPCRGEIKYKHFLPVYFNTYRCFKKGDSGLEETC